MEELLKKLKEDLDALGDYQCEQTCGSCSMNVPVIYAETGYYDFCSVVKKLRNAL